PSEVNGGNVSRGNGEVAERVDDGRAAGTAGAGRGQVARGWTARGFAVRREDEGLLRNGISDSDCFHHGAGDDLHWVLVWSAIARRRGRCERSKEGQPKNEFAAPAESRWPRPSSRVRSKQSRHRYRSLVVGGAPRASRFA